VELAFVAALQHLPARPRAVLILREVLQFSAAEVADALDTSVAAVNSALQRARRALRQHPAAGEQAAELLALGAPGRRELVRAFVAAWERADVDALVSLLADDVRFSMPPLAAWFCGRPAVRGFIAERLLAEPWRVVPVGANGQLAFACYQAAGSGPPFRLSAINVIRVRGGRIAELTGFLDPGVYRRFGLPAELPGGDESWS
jgi:RNA polymerase sigma-70 factor (TIGR02960 family)